MTARPTWLNPLSFAERLHNAASTASTSAVRIGDRLQRCAWLVGLLLIGLAQLPAHSQEPPRQSADYIVAVVNRELVTNSEVQQRVERLEQEAAASGARAPSREELQREVLDQLIDERAQLGVAREGGVRVDEADLDRTVASVAAQNQLSVADLRERLRADGQDYPRFRDNLRDRMLLERLREREVQARLRIVDADIENWLVLQREKSGASNEFNIAQILIGVRDGASATEVAARRAVAVNVLQRLRRGDALPDLFVEAVQPLLTGEVAPQVVRSGAGFHVLKLVERKDAALSITQSHARHVLLRPGPGLSQETVIERLAEYRQRVLGGRVRFEDLARQYSEDGSAPNGGDLGWAAPGQFVPEFEQAMQDLSPGGISAPVVSRFGVHLIQLIERRQVSLDVRQQREVARNALREQKYEETYLEWAREVRARAYVELRDPPGL